MIRTLARRFALGVALIGTLIAASVSAQSIPYSFSTQSGVVPASELDSNFAYVLNYATRAPNLTGTLNAAQFPALSGDCTTVAGSLSVVCTKTNGASFTSAATTSIGSSGATIPLLNGTNTWSGLQTFSGGISASSITGLTTPLSQAQGGTGATAIGTAAFQNTGTSGATIPMLNGVDTWSGTQQFTAGLGVGATSSSGVAFVNSYSGSGSPGLQLVTQGSNNGAFIIGRNGSTADGAADVADVSIVRTAAYSGGTIGFVNSALRLFDTVSAGTTADEWTLSAVMDNNGTSADASQNVAIYGRAIKESTGRTWASTFELDDKSTNPTVGTVTTELDLLGSGGDDNGNRVILDLWGKSQTGAADTIDKGIRFNLDANTTLNKAVVFNGAAFGTGIDFTGGTFSLAPIVVGSGQKICLDGSTCSRYLFFSGGVAYLHVSGGNLFSFSDAGGFNASSLSSASYSVSGQSTVVSAAGFAGGTTYSSLTGAAAAQVGTGASLTCATSHVCDQFSGELTLTTGTGTLATGTIGTVNFSTARANKPNCEVRIASATDAAYKALGTIETTGALSFTVGVALTASTTYTLTYICGGV